MHHARGGLSTRKDRCSAISTMKDTAVDRSTAASHAPGTPVRALPPMRATVLRARDRGLVLQRDSIIMPTAGPCSTQEPLGLPDATKRVTLTGSDLPRRVNPLASQSDVAARDQREDRCELPSQASVQPFNEARARHQYCPEPIQAQSKTALIKTARACRRCMAARPATPIGDAPAACYCACPS